MYFASIRRLICLVTIPGVAGCAGANPPDKTAVPADKTALQTDKAPPQTKVTEEQLRALNEDGCKARGFDWLAIPGLCGPDEGSGCGFKCDIPTKDAGKACQGAADCEGACLCAHRSDTEHAEGVCSKHVYYTEVSDCVCMVEGGTASHPHGCA